MSGANHVTGGLVYTGIIASFFNINIFEDPLYIFFTVIFCLLADIDHTRSPVGKLFYPLAKYLDRKYGHRTITHSLVFYLAIYLIIRALETVFNLTNIISLLFLVSYSSHLIFDMMTKQGIPLFYPFRRNPCVIPGKPEMRLKSNDFKTESIIFVIFIVLGTTCQPLFANGFWSTYNNAFGTLDHVHREFKHSKEYLKVDYDYINNGIHESSSAIVVKTEDQFILLFNKEKKLFEVNKTYHNSKFKIQNTKQDYITYSVYFDKISIDSLNKLLNNLILISLTVNSPLRIQAFYNDEIKITSNHKFEYAYNPVFSALTDTNISNIPHQIKLIKYELHQDFLEEKIQRRHKDSITQRFVELKYKINTNDLYVRENLTKELHEAETKLKDLKPYNSKKQLLNIKLTHLTELLNMTEKSILLKGNFTYITPPSI